MFFSSLNVKSLIKKQYLFFRDQCSHFAQQIKCNGNRFETESSSRTQMNEAVIIPEVRKNSGNQAQVHLYEKASFLIVHKYTHTHASLPKITPKLVVTKTCKQPSVLFICLNVATKLPKTAPASNTIWNNHNNNNMMFFCATCLNKNTIMFMRHITGMLCWMFEVPWRRDCEYACDARTEIQRLDPPT